MSKGNGKGQISECSVGSRTRSSSLRTGCCPEGLVRNDEESSACSRVVIPCWFGGFLQRRKAKACGAFAAHDPIPSADDATVSFDSTYGVWVL